MMLMIVLAVIIVLVTLYVIWGRNWLKARTWPWSKRFFEIIEPAEIKLWGKSETILWSRFLQLLGVIGAVLTWLGSLDFTPYLALVPEKYRPWLMATPFAAVTLSGIVSEILRRDTTLPLALVAVPDKVPPVVQEQVAKVDEAKQAAIRTVQATLHPTEAPKPSAEDKE